MPRFLLSFFISFFVSLTFSAEVRSATCLPLSIIFGPASQSICQASCGDDNGTCFFDAEVSVEEFFTDAQCELPCSANAEPVCGNNIVESGEECDDGNTTDGDGCSSSCLNDGPPPAVCGNSLIEAGEECDDGNVLDEDGCSSSCQTEAPVQQCENLQTVFGNDAQAQCLTQCSDLPEAACFFDPTISTEVLYKDSVCTVECDGPADPVCGNGIVETGEECDDGNNTPLDGCSPACRNQAPPAPVCGNGILELGEFCDDGNNINGDGCNSVCATETVGECLPLDRVFGPASPAICLDACGQSECFFDATVSNELLYINDSCSIACGDASQPPEDVIPRFECVRNNKNGSFTAFFGYNNPNDFDVTLDIGVENEFSPAPINRGQPTVFVTGETQEFPNAAFSVDFNGNDLTWNLDGNSVTVNSNSRECPVCTALNTVNLDFNDQAKGSIIDDEFIDLGVLILAKNNFSQHPDLAIIFDSSNPSGGDLDLGTPNVVFGGPGVGAGGTLTNDRSLEKVLIIAENANDNNRDGLIDVPDDEARGGSIEFLFNQSVAIHSLDLLDISENGVKLEFKDVNGDELSELSVPSLGDNSLQTIAVDQGDFVTKKLEVELTGSGALDNLTFCQDPNAAAPVCGDAELNFDEECDDGNLNDGDGCDSSCLIEDDDDSSDDDSSDDDDSQSDDNNSDDDSQSDDNSSDDDDDSSDVRSIFSDDDFDDSQFSVLEICSGENEVLYGVSSSNGSNSTFFKYDIAKRKTKKISADSNIDIEAMDIHPLSGQIYAITGDAFDSQSQKKLLMLDRESGIPNLDQGIQLELAEGQEFQGASFNPITNELWAIGRGLGLRTVNLQTGLTELKADIQAEVESLAWDDEGENLYFYIDNDIARFNRSSGKTKRICTLNLRDTVEAMEFNNDGKLVLTTKAKRKHKTQILDLNSCELSDDRDFRGMPKNKGRIKSVSFGCES